MPRKILNLSYLLSIAKSRKNMWISLRLLNSTSCCNYSVYLQTICSPNLYINAPFDGFSFYTIIISLHYLYMFRLIIILFIYYNTYTFCIIFRKYTNHIIAKTTPEWNFTIRGGFSITIKAHLFVRKRQNVPEKLLSA